MSFFRRCRHMMQTVWGRGAGFALLLLLALSATTVAHGQTAPAHSVLRTRSPISGSNITAAIASATYMGPVNPSSTVSFEFVLPLRNETALNDLIARLYDPSDPLYGQYLTSQQFRAQYAPTQAQIAAVTAYAQAHGFIVDSVSDSGFAVRVTGTAAAVTAALGVRIGSYLGADGRTFTVPDKTPAIPNGLSGQVLAILGLDQSLKALSHAHRYVPSPSSPIALPDYAQPLGFYTSAPSGLTPADIHQLYNIPAGGYNGQGQTLGLLELDTYTPSDISTYESTYDLGSAPLTNVGVNGFNTATPPGGGADEVTLDIEMQLALSPDAAGILVYEDSNSGGATFDVLDKMASDDKATTISTSWGLAEDFTEGQAVSENMPLTQMAAQGQSFFAAAGDAGAYDDQEIQTIIGGTPTLSVDDPASQPYVTGVGGTNLSDTAGIAYVSESAWGDPADTGRGPKGTGSGGGISGIWPIPAWQTPLINPSVNSQASTTMRNVPDVSLSGDYDTNYYSVYFTDPVLGPGFYGYDGTSAAAPLWSSFTALVNQERKSRRASAIGFLNPSLYKIAGSPTQYASDFHDISDGSTNNYYIAVPGYDNATGLGSFNGQSLLNDLISVVTPPVIESFSPTFGPVGTQVTIAGTGLQGATQVAFNGTPATTFTDVSATTITAVVPAGATSGPISVTTPNGVASSATNFDLPPVITSFSPTSGPYGTTVTISGLNFVDAESVSFTGPAGQLASNPAFTVLSNTTITATVPVGAVTGPITVIGPAGTATSATNFVVKLDAPAVTSFTPTTGPVTTQVTITGINFYQVNSVTFNGAAASFTVNSATQVTASVPLTATTGPISVSTPGGTATSAMNFTVVNPVPTITSFTPTSGPALVTIVTISGTGFYGVESVTFNGVASATVTVVSPTQIQATVPNAATSGLIRVTTPGGTAVSFLPFTVTKVPPRITGFSPTVVSISATVTVIGVGFAGTTSMTLHGQSIPTFTVVNDGTITFSVPLGATTGPIVVLKGALSSASANNLVIVPQITDFTPPEGPTGTPVTITGTSFTGLSAVRFNGVLSTKITFVSDTEVTAVVPAGAQTGPISVTATAGTAFSPASFIVGIPPAAAPTIISLSPGGGPVGTVVTILGTNFKGTNPSGAAYTTTLVKFNGVVATFTVVNATTITATVPTGATSGPISVITPNGTAVSTTSFDLPPTITGFTPGGGAANSAVTIMGTNLKDASVVMFNGVPVTGSIATSSNTMLTVIVPTSTSGPIMVTTPGGSATSKQNFDYPPTIVSFTPAGGPGGTVVTLTGTNFLNTSSVLFNGVAATAITVDSNTTLTVTAPPSAGTGFITVTNPGGTVTTSSLGGPANPNYYYPPTIASFAPVSGPVTTTLVTITGTNLGGNGVTAVSFNGVASTNINVTASTSLTASVPINATTGKITVTTPGGSAQTAMVFTVLPTLPVPTITGFTPTSGPAGTVVTITGTNFIGTVGVGGSYTTTAVVFGGVRATIFSVNAAGTQITATVPAGVTSGPIQVTTTGGTATSTGIYNAPPAILSFTPNVGAPAGGGMPGTLVTINGANFTPTTTVAFMGIPAASVMVLTTNQIQVTVPAGATNGAITVATAFGTASTAPSLFYLQPTITGFSPSGGGAGTVVTISGTNFLGATSVTFNGIAAAFTVVSNSAISTTVPADVASGVIIVTTPFGTATSAGDFLLPPTIIGFTPTSGPTGTLVTITGSNFKGSAQMPNVLASVTFNGFAASVYTVVSNTVITAVVPLGATSGAISVTTLGGTATTAGSFTVVVQAPTIGGFSPTAATIGSTVTIIGSGLVGITSVSFNGVSAVVTSVTNTQIVATVPAGATTGPITVTGGGKSAVSGNNFVVLPSIISLSSASGHAGQTVTILGSAFNGATVVRFNGLAAAFVLNSSTMITATVPTGVSSGYVSVLTPSGTAYSPTQFVVTP